MSMALEQLLAPGGELNFGLKPMYGDSGCELAS